MLRAHTEQLVAVCKSNGSISRHDRFETTRPRERVHSGLVRGFHHQFPRFATKASINTITGIS